MSQPNRLVRPILIVVVIALLALLLSRLGGSSSERSAPSPASSTTHAPAPRARTSRAITERQGPLRLPSGEIAADASRRAGAFSGRVIAARTGAPIEGATLTFDHDGVARAITSGADGAFLFEPPAPGVYALAMVAAKGFHPFAPAWGESPITLIARAGEVVRGLTITLEPERRYEGMVLTPTGEPAPKAEVRILEAPGGEASAGGHFIADDKGAFSFSAPDDALLEATHPDHARARARLDMRAQASGRVTLRLRPKGEAVVLASITGLVLDAAGAPVPFASVSAHFHREIAARDDDLHPGAEATTDERGAFTLEGLDPGTYELTAREGARIAHAEGIAAGAEGVTLRLAAAGRIRGTVRSGNPATPVASFSVVAARHRGPLERDASTGTSFFDATGAYEIGDLLPGTYAVTAAALGHAPSATMNVTVPAGGEATADLLLRTGGRLHGIVLEDDTKTPIEGARITLEGVLGAGASPIPVVADATTDASGHFSLLGLAEGARSVTATAPNHHGRILSGLVVTEGGDIGPVTISLAKLKEGEEPRMELTGIGAVLSPKDDALIIGQVLPGGGAANAGLSPGDAILAIDGAPIVELGFEGAVQRIRGPEGSVVKLSIRRSGTGEPTDVAVRRTRVRS
ncbi:carboxypeptidase regulatory-like domain-containing protein [Polyangium sp. 6x1]|uniref:carboxypeptidase regulatory-like domain-containing protein n=1 Tax=Polyangium sp. 6x1 TaxID=3042689 RepID=UPI0024831B26|nr:carboxypeptidase regulatory-like domain-containing protein [Polyangium sp. 6x1]MDI1450222.1 carboxypeptidase regulatory-like domain-containing protein [Polyangium sp. 6x1]